MSSCNTVPHLATLLFFLFHPLAVYSLYGVSSVYVIIGGSHLTDGFIWYSTNLPLCLAYSLSRLIYRSKVFGSHPIKLLMLVLGSNPFSYNFSPRNSVGIIYLYISRFTSMLQYFVKLYTIIKKIFFSINFII
jgi:hypothetical protein